MDLLHHHQVVSLIRNMQHSNPNYPADLRKRDRAFFALLYLSGVRISEILRSNRVANRYKSVDKNYCEPIQKHDIEFENKYGKAFMIVKGVRCLKRRDIQKRHIPVPVFRDVELVGFIKEWLDLLPFPESFIFDFTDQNAQYLASIYFKKERLFCHAFRHLCFSRLATEYSFSGEQLRHFAGWASSTMTSVYTHMNYQDLCLKLSHGGGS